MEPRVHGMNWRKCIVPNCQSTGVKTFHSFPKDFVQGQKWLEAINNPSLNNISYTDIYKKKYKLCQKHFDENAYMGSILRPRLKADAIPTKNLPPPETYENELNEKIISLPLENENYQHCQTTSFMTSHISPGLTYSSIRTHSDDIRKSSLMTPKKRKLENTMTDKASDKKTFLELQGINYPIYSPSIETEENVLHNFDKPNSQTYAENDFDSPVPPAKKKKFSLGKPYNIPLTPIAKNIYTISKKLRKCRINAIQRLKRYEIQHIFLPSLLY